MLLLIYVLNTYIVLCFRIEMDEGRGTLASYASWSGVSARSGHLASPPVLLNPMSWPPLRRVLVSDDELCESDDESERVSPSAL